MIANKPTQLEEQIGYKISDFYLKKHNGNYKDAAKEVESLNIVRIHLNESKELVVESARPGLMIGRHGANINALQDFIGLKIRLIEAFHWNIILVPYDYDPVEY